MRCEIRVTRRFLLTSHPAESEEKGGGANTEREREERRRKFGVRRCGVEGVLARNGMRGKGFRDQYHAFIRLSLSLSRSSLRGTRENREK